MLNNFAIKDWRLYFPNLPRLGMMLNGMLSDLVIWDFPTSGSAYGWLPTITATEWKGTPRSRFKGSKDYRGGRTSEALRTGFERPAILAPDFAELFQGYPTGWTVLKP